MSDPHISATFLLLRRMLSRGPLRSKARSKTNGGMHDLLALYVYKWYVCVLGPAVGPTETHAERVEAANTPSNVLSCS